jgi:hypothetical protein
MERLQTATDGGVTVRVAALTRNEARDAFGFRLDHAGIQPVWIEVPDRERIRA